MVSGTLTKGGKVVVRGALAKKEWLVKTLTMAHKKPPANAGGSIAYNPEGLGSGRYFV